MILSKALIKKMLRSSDERRRLIVTPLLDEDEQVGSNSIDVRLGNEFVLINRQTGLMGIDPLKRADLTQHLKRYQSRINVPLGSPFYLHPQDFCLARTLEFIALPPTACAYVIGRSSWGRLGLIIATATMVEPGPSFKGTIVLELANVGSVPIVLYPMVRIAQLVLHTVEDDGSKQVPESIRDTVQSDS